MRTDLLHLSKAIISSTPLFDQNWYLRQYPDVADNGIDPIEHYLLHGAEEFRDPSQQFHTEFYLEKYPDVQAAGMNPLLHYILHGRAEGRATSRFATTRVAPAPVSKTKILKGAVERCIFVSGEALDRPGFVYRIERYAHAIKILGGKPLVIHFKDLNTHIDAITNARFLYIWRAAFDHNIQNAIMAARESGTPVIFDLDDLMIRSDIVDETYIDAIRFNNHDPARVVKHYGDIHRTMMTADCCTASTHELAWQMRRDRPHKQTFVLPNGFSEDTYRKSRLHYRRKQNDGLIRIGYASGSRTHQADFRICSNAIARVLRERPECRLVLFERNGLVTLDATEFPEFDDLEDQIEWRSYVRHSDLPAEIARFDVNLVPLEVGNPFVEAKSELKFFEAAICDVPTVASPTGPFKRAMEHGRTGFLATTETEWYDAVKRLVDSPKERSTIAAEAHRSVLWAYGPARRVDLMATMLDIVKRDRSSARAFQRIAGQDSEEQQSIPLADRTISFAYQSHLTARVSIIVPLYNYERFVLEALSSAAAQTLAALELIVVDDHSTDQSHDVTLRWMEANKERFTRCILVKHVTNQGLGASRNTAFDLADALHVMALDADNILYPTCTVKCLEAIDRTGASFVYPTLRRIGDESGAIGNRPYDPGSLVPGNYIDAMAMISKEAWAYVGGYTTHRMGWQDYDLWCRFIEKGLMGYHVDETLADYRVHGTSMLRSSTEKTANKQKLNEWMETQHPWLSLTLNRDGHRVLSNDNY